jgi:hypothetical protein
MTNETKRPRRAWIWFFFLLGLLATSGIVWEVWFNQQQQLTPEALRAARRRWDAHGPSDYRLEYSIKRESNPDLAGPAPKRYEVEVRDGRVRSATDSGGHSLQPGQYEFGNMDSLFEFIRDTLRADASPDRPRAFVKASFDEKDGHVNNYVHSVTRTRERLEVTVKLVREEDRPN